MDNEEKKETFADKAKAQFDALKTQEGRDAIKNKAKEGVEGAKRLWNAASIVQRVVVLVAVVLVTIFLVRSCSPNTPAVVASTDTTQQEKNVSPKFDGSVDLAKENDKTDSQKSFVGFTFGTKADEFKDVTEKMSGKTLEYYVATPKLKSKFRLFDSAYLQFTRKDRRLYKITIQTKAEHFATYKPTAILREAQYCAAMIERKYGQKFNLANKSRLYSASKEVVTGNDSWDLLIGMAGGMRNSGETAKVVGSAIYSDNNQDSKFAIAPAANYHGFFNNTIEVEVSCCGIDEKYLGITISAMDHSVIEEEGGRTKVIPLDADDDEGNL